MRKNKNKIPPTNMICDELDFLNSLQYKEREALLESLYCYHLEKSRGTDIFINYIGINQRSGLLEVSFTNYITIIQGNCFAIAGSDQEYESYQDALEALKNNDYDL